MPSNTVTCLYNCLLKDPNFYHIKPKSSCPQKLSKKDGQFAVLALARGHANSALDLQCNFFLHVHPETVHNTPQEQGLSARRKQSVPLLTQHHIRSRLEWARAHQSWSMENRERVIFSDESKFNLFGSDGLHCCWRREGEGLSPCYAKKKVKHGGKKVMVWGFVTAYGVGWLYQIDGKIDSKKYISILQEAYLRTLEDLHTNRQAVILQADNDPKDTSKATWAWLAENQIPTLNWSATSPDMNIMENLWAYLDYHVWAHPTKLLNSTELWNVLQEGWKRISPEYVGKLYEFLPRCVEKVCNA